MKLPSQPVCSCLECKYYGLVYSTLVNVYKCKECKATVRGNHVEDIISAYGVYKSSNPPILIPNYNALNCISCLRKGGLKFKGSILESVYCDKCRYDIPMNYLYDAMCSAYKTKLLEKTYNSVYTVFGG